MTKNLKLQDVLMVFIKELETVKTKLGTDEKIISATNQKLEEIKNTEVKVDSSSLKAILQRNEKTFKKYEEALKNLSIDHEEKIKAASKKANQYELYFYSALAFLFSLSSAFLAYGLNQHHHKKEAERKMEFYFREAASRNDFLKENNLKQKFKEWKLKEAK
ncbi:hypothetical protein [Daejeonia sp. YH14]|uniref:hypothetical protein n=1 Tax=Daejeonia sp. YH14 TaxID=3439042 RepID=UPI003F49B292